MIRLKHKLAWLFQASVESSRDIRMSLTERVLFVGVLAYGMVLRAWDLDAKPFHVDEAETSINALTILEHGVPVDHYLGQPIYENTLTQPWPGSDEYEFKDSSYSARGLAVYHGWLPLYATAASFAIAGIEPDGESTALAVRHSPEAMHGRTVAGRVPAVLFGMLFLVAIFFAARAWYGQDAGWAALAAAVICEPVLYYARHARYYSATLALAACAAWCMCLIYRRGGWRDFLLGALVFVLLFHTHVVSFLAASVAFAFTVPFLFRHSTITAKLSAFAAIVAAGIGPWIVLTGWWDARLDIPKARSLLSLHDLWEMVRTLGVFPAVGVLALVWPLVAGMLRGKLPDRFIEPFTAARGKLLFSWGWTGAGLLAFVWFIPAPSYFYGRMALTIMVPAFLCCAIFFAAIARVISPRLSPFVAPGLFVLTLVLAGKASFWGPRDLSGSSSIMDVVEHLRTMDLRPGARVYATPNDHLTLTFYTGIPNQSVAPVRRSFLNAAPGEILILEAGPRYQHFDWKEIQLELQEAGYPLTDAEARHWAPLLNTRLTRQDLAARVARVNPPLEPAPPFLDAFLTMQRRKTARSLENFARRTGNPMLDGYDLVQHPWWQVFYYRFVDPQSRMGPNLNYVDRIRLAEATVLPSGWVVIRCPKLPARE